MSAPLLNTALVATLSGGHFDDTLAPPSVAANAAAAAASAAAAAASAVQAANAAANAAVPTAVLTARDQAVAASTAATAAATAAAASAAAAVAAGGGVSQTYVDGQIAGLSNVARTGDYASLLNRPAIPVNAVDVGAVALTAAGAANGYGTLDGAAHLQAAQVRPGHVTRVYCPNDVKPPRPTSRLDVYVDWFSVTPPLPVASGGPAVTGDGWVRWAG